MSLRKICACCLITFSLGKTQALSNSAPDMNVDFINATCQSDSGDTECLKRQIALLKNTVKVQKIIIDNQQNKTAMHSNCSSEADGSSYPGWSLVAVPATSVMGTITTIAGPLSQLCQNIWGSYKYHEQPKIKDVSWAGIDFFANMLTLSTLVIQNVAQGLEITSWNYVPNGAAAFTEVLIIINALYWMKRKMLRPRIDEVPM